MPFAAARDGVVGSIQAKASADDVNSAARSRRVAPKQYFSVPTASPSTLTSLKPDSCHWLGGGVLIRRGGVSEAF